MKEMFPMSLTTSLMAQKEMGPSAGLRVESTESSTTSHWRTTYMITLSLITDVVEALNRQALVFRTRP